MNRSPQPDRTLGRALSGAAGMAAAACAAISLFGIMLLMLMDVAGRYLFNAPVPGAAEVIELAMGMTVFSAFPLVTARREHIQLDYLSKALAGRVRSLTDALVASISAAGMALLAWRIGAKALTIAQYGDTTPFLRIPIGPIAYFIAFCAAATTLIFLWQALILWQQTVLGNPADNEEGSAP